MLEFSEEYNRKTAAILLSTEHGKAQGIWGEITAALGLICYVSVMVLYIRQFLDAHTWHRGSIECLESLCQL